MSPYDRSRSGGRSSDRRSSDRRSSGRFDRRSSNGFKKEMHTVVCDKCGESCQVPFKPTSSKPVYCRDCFRKENGGESGNRRESSPRQESNEFKQINEKLDKILEMLNDL